MKVKTFAKNSLALCIAAASLSAHAADKTWMGDWACGSNEWTAACWSTAGDVSNQQPPAPGDNVYLAPYSYAYSSTSVIYRGPSEPVGAFNNLVVDSYTSFDWTLVQEGNLASHNEVIGINYSGTHHQLNGTNTVAETLTLGQQAYSNGTYRMDDGALTAKNIVVGPGWGQFYQGSEEAAGGTPTVDVSETLLVGRGTYTLARGALTAKDEVVGLNGNAVFTQKSGTNTVAGTLTISKNDSPGIYYLDNRYVLEAGKLQAQNIDIGDNTVGAFEQVTGTVVVGETLTVGKLDPYAYWLPSSYTLRSGDLTAKNVIVGDAGGGQFIQQAGTHAIAETLTVGRQSNPGNYYYANQNQYTLIDGTLTAKNQIIGDGAGGIFSQQGGTNTVAETLTVGKQASAYNYYYNQGQYLLVDGALAAKDEIVGDFGYGLFDQKGGTNTVTATLTIGKQQAGTGSYGLDVGSLNAGEENVGDGGSGYFTHRTGSNTVANTLTLGKQTAASGYYALLDGAVAAKNFVVGDAGYGRMAQGSDGYFYPFYNAAASGENSVVAIAETLTIGRQATSYGTYQLFAGKLQAKHLIVGAGGSGGFQQGSGYGYGSSVELEKLTIGQQAGSTGYYGLTSGALTAIDQIIGDAGHGEFAQSDYFGYGSSNKVSGTLTLGKQAGSSGSYWFDGGSLEASTVVVGDAGSGSFYQSGGTHTVSGNLTLGKQAGSYGRYELRAGRLTTADQVIGDAGRGEFTQGDYFGYGSTNTVNGTLTLGRQAGGEGSYHLISGSLTAGDEIIGDAGRGEFTQGEYFGYGSTNTVDGTLTLGKQAGSQGVYNLLAGALSAAKEIIGDAGIGIFDQSGGTNTVAETLTLGKQASGEGTYKLSAGVLTATDEIIGDAGIGTFTQGEGNYGYSSSNTVSGTLTLGKQAGGSGVYNLIAGLLKTKDTVVGDAGTGTFNQLGGKHTVDGALTIGKQAEGSGAYNLTAGELTTSRTVVGDAGFGAFTQSGGTHTTQALTLGKQAGSFGSYTQLGGTLNAHDVVVGDAGIGVFTQAAGTHNVNSLTLGKQSGSEGTYNLRGGDLNVKGDIVNGAGTGALLISGGSLNFGAGNHNVDVDTLKLTSQGKIALTDGATTTFERAVSHNGKAIDLAAGTNAIFNGAFSGKGPFTGAGTATFNSVLNVGDGPVTFNVAGNMVLGEHSKSILEVKGTDRGTGYDAFNIGGALTLNGELNLVSLNGFHADLGNVFDLISAETITGQFDLLTLLTLDAGLTWKIEYLVDAIGTKDLVRLSVVSSVPLPASIWLMQFALFGLGAVKRYNRKSR